VAPQLPGVTPRRSPATPRRRAHGQPGPQGLRPTRRDGERWQPRSDGTGRVCSAGGEAGTAGGREPGSGVAPQMLNPQENAALGAEPVSRAHCRRGVTGDVRGEGVRERGRLPSRVSAGSSAGSSRAHPRVLLKSWKRRGNGDQRTQRNQGDGISTPDSKTNRLLG